MVRLSGLASLVYQEFHFISFLYSDFTARAITFEPNFVISKPETPNYALHCV